MRFRYSLKNADIMITVWLIGLISGLLLMLTSSTLNFWLAENQLSLINISLFSLISLPYAINFLWAPILDSIKIPVLSNIIGFRESWILILSILTAVTILCLSRLVPQQNLLAIAMISFIIAFFSSCLDIVFGAIRSEITCNKYGSTAGFYLFGYRTGMIISKSGTIYLSSYLSWHIIFNLLCLIIMILVTLTLYFLPKSANDYKSYNKNSIDDRNFFGRILAPIGNKDFIAVILLFLVLYRLPDNILTIMISPYFLAKGFSATDIALSGYLFGSIAAVIGGIIGGVVIDFLGIYKSLFYFGIMHALSHLSFNLLEIFGAEVYLISVIIGVEGFTGGMAMAAYIALISSLSQGRYSGTQYSLLSAMMGVSRAIIPSTAGIIVIKLGWHMFFVLMVILSIPSIYMLRRYLIDKIIT